MLWYLPPGADPDAWGYLSLRCDVPDCWQTMWVQVMDVAVVLADGHTDALVRDSLSVFRERGWKTTSQDGPITRWRWACPAHVRTPFESYMAAYSRTPIRSGFEHAVERRYIDEMRHMTPPRQPDPRLSTITPPSAHTAIKSSYSGVSSTPSIGQGFVRGHDWAHPVSAHPGYRSMT